MSRITLTDEEPQASEWAVPWDLDPECEALCHALNAFPGIATIESCCGHGEHPYRVWFRVRDLEALPPVLYYFDGCHCGFYGWKVIARTDCGMSPVSFMVEGPTGEEAYREADKIAGYMNEYLADPDLWSADVFGVDSEDVFEDDDD